MSELTPMTVAGIMSGTSADGIDVAFTRITPNAKDAAFPQLKLLAHAGFPFPPALRRAVLAAMNAEAHCDRRVGAVELAAGAGLLRSDYRSPETPSLPPRSDRLPRPNHLPPGHARALSGTRRRLHLADWRDGNLAQQSGVPVVSNFRPADMVVGGQGAPLVPLLDYVLFRHPTRGRVLQNLGGIGNLTALPANAGPSQLVAFDTGPANMVIDQLMQQLFDKRFDRGGKTAARGAVMETVVTARLREPFFAARPPKSAGREQFGSDYAARFLEQCRKAGASREDTIASATALTARSVGYGLLQFPVQEDASHAGGFYRLRRRRAQ